MIRISGPACRVALDALFTPSRPRSGYVPWMMHHGTLHDAAGQILDDVLAVFMPGPGTFTGEDVAELHCHGGPVLMSAVLDEVLRYARLAERGEFSKRAYLNGRFDLSQAEAVAELIDATTRAGVRFAVDKVKGLLGTRVKALGDALENLRARICLAVDFPDDEMPPLPRDEFIREVDGVRAGVSSLLEAVGRTRVWRDGITVALAGPVNAGKSSILNALVGRNRAIVTPIPGTTRDFLEETVSLDGVTARIIDTAGFRTAVSDEVEAEGIRLGMARIREADQVVLVVDGATGSADEVLGLSRELPASKLVLVWNKIDISPMPADFHTWIPRAECLGISAGTGQGIDELAQLIRRLSLQGVSDAETSDIVVPNARQARALKSTLEALDLLRADAEAELPYELCSVRLEEATQILADIIGVNTADDVLNRVFDTFCVGK